MKNQIEKTDQQIRENKREKLRIVRSEEIIHSFFQEDKYNKAHKYKGRIKKNLKESTRRYLTGKEDQRQYWAEQHLKS